MDREQDKVTDRRFSRRKFTAAFSAAVASAACARTGAAALADGRNVIGHGSVPADQYARCVDRGHRLPRIAGAGPGRVFRRSGRRRCRCDGAGDDCDIRHGRTVHDPLVAKSLKIHRNVRAEGWRHLLTGRNVG